MVILDISIGLPFKVMAGSFKFRDDSKPFHHDGQSYSKRDEFDLIGRFDGSERSSRRLE
jgi:hypothetical protein